MQYYEILHFLPSTSIQNDLDIGAKVRKSDLISPVAVNVMLKLTE